MGFAAKSSAESLPDRSALQKISKQTPVKRKRRLKAAPQPLLEESERIALIVENQEHGYRMAWRLLANWRVRLAVDDVRSVVGIALCEAAHRFDPRYETSFKTFFFYHLRGLLLKEVGALINDRNLLRLQSDTASGSIEEFGSQVFDEAVLTLIERRTPERLLHAKEQAEICRRAYEQLDELEREIIVRYFMEDMSLMKIARDLGYCRCHLSRVKSKALHTLAEVLGPLFHGVEGDNARPRPVPTRLGYTGGRGRRRSKTELRRSAA